MPTSPTEDVPARDPQEREEEYTICPNCGADLLCHRCTDARDY